MHPPQPHVCADQQETVASDDHATAVGRNTFKMANGHTIDAVRTPRTGSLAGNTVTLHSCDG